MYSFGATWWAWSVIKKCYIIYRLRTECYIKKRLSTDEHYIYVLLPILLFLTGLWVFPTQSSFSNVDFNQIRKKTQFRKWSFGFFWYYLSYLYFFVSFSCFLFCFFFSNQSIGVAAYELEHLSKWRKWIVSTNHLF